ncbi:oligosaccharide flippase family protein [Rhodococcus sp. F64268]|uniref:oligosaccharide flippase family protein n=1 Tax=Rhodococcus sp. F64268 TaxID=2926402 RepID=UPI001FF4C8B7|nr:oligosaccharide flippase family protein [Rhodococcus sp. F64268]MCK0090483.1 oligosaccharide flippase family protein [Rhodococcus sp. F64268]
MNKVQRLASGMAWNYGSQVGTACAQFFYAAVTSRLVSSSGFGAYAIALTVAGLITVVSNGGLGQSVGRMTSLDTSALKGLSLYALILGVVAGSFMFLSADLWSALWGYADAAPLIAWLSVSALFAPHLGMTSGFIRREGRFRTLAFATFSTNLLGMALGLAIVVQDESGIGLIASPIIAQLGLWITLTALTRGQLLRVGAFKSARSDIGFSWGITLSSVLSYLANNLGKWSVSRWVGTAALGQWNRSDVVTTVPFFQMQTAIIQVVYPEFRHDRVDSTRARTVWPDLLALVAWVTVPAGYVGAVLLPVVVPILFGPGWEQAAVFASILSVVCGIQAVTTVLGSAVEALGKFKWIWSSQVIMICIQIVAVMATIYSRSAVPAIIALGVVAVARQIWYVTLCHRAGYIDAERLYRHYTYVLIGSLAAALVAQLFVKSAGSIMILVPTLTVIAGAATLYRFKERFPPVVILRSYGVFRKRESRVSADWPEVPAVAKSEK